MNVQHYFNRAQFPTTGMVDTLHADDSTGQWFWWINNGYTMVQPPLSAQPGRVYQDKKP